MDKETTKGQPIKSTKKIAKSNSKKIFLPGQCQVVKEVESKILVIKKKAQNR